MPVQIGAKPESNFANPIGLLSDCHRRIERFIDVLLRVAEHARGGTLTDEERVAMETALRYFREAAPRHTADEEESLFPRLRRIDTPAVRDLLTRVDALEQDHDSADPLHAEADRLGQEWLRNETLDSQSSARLTAILHDLRDMYARHIATEDAEVFPVAAAELSADDREAIGREMAGRRGLKS